jgi:hypothetical protein
MPFFSGERVSELDELTIVPSEVQFQQRGVRLGKALTLLHLAFGHSQRSSNLTHRRSLPDETYLLVPTPSHSNAN